MSQNRNILRTGAVAAALIPSLAKVPDANAERAPKPTPHEQRLNRVAQRAVSRMVAKVEHLPFANISVESTSQPWNKLVTTTYTVDDKSGKGRYIFDIQGPYGLNGPNDLKGNLLAGRTKQLTIREEAVNADKSSTTYAELTYSRNPRNNTWEVGGVYHKSNSQTGPDSIIGAGIDPIAPNDPHLDRADLRSFIAQSNRVIGMAANKDTVVRLHPAFSRPTY